MTCGEIILLILLNLVLASGSVLPQNQNEKLLANGTGTVHTVESLMLPCGIVGNISQRQNPHRILSGIPREVSNTPDDDHLSQKFTSSSSGRSHVDLEEHLNLTSGGQGSSKNDTDDQYWDAAHQSGIMKMQSLRFRTITENTTG